MTKWFVLHGWGGDSTTNWFPWLKEYQETKGNEVFVPDFPNAEFPKYNEWKEYWNENYASKVNEDSVLVGHSLGGGFLLRWLSENLISTDRLILVAPTPDDCGIDEIKDFFEKPWNTEVLKQNIGTIEIFGAENDPYIPVEKLKQLASELGAIFKDCPGKGHLNEKELFEIL